MMRALEILLLCSGLALSLAMICLRGRSPWTLTLAVLLLSVLAAHLALEGLRQPMLPLYLMTGLLLMLVAVALLWPALPFRHVIGVACLTGLSAAGIYAGYLRPVVVLPPPGGTFAVGQTEMLLDESGIDIAAITPETAPPRVQLLYPAVPAPDEAPGLIESLSRPAGPRDETMGRRDVALAPSSQSFSVLLYFPGWPGTAVENQLLLRALVSQGYVVAALAYPRKLPGMTDAAVRKIVKALEYYPLYSSEAAYHAAVAQSIARVNKRAQDASRVVDALTALNDPKHGARFAGRLDLERIGILGFSLGGAVSVQAAGRDPRFKAVVNMDGRHWAEGREEGVRQPYLFVSELLPLPTDADLHSPNADWRYNSIEDLSDYTKTQQNLERNGGVHVTINGMAHMNFTDAGLRSPLRRYTDGGPIDPLRGLAITTAYVQAFFGKTLRGEDSPLLSGQTSAQIVPQTSPYPEVLVQIYPPPTPQSTAAH